MRFGVLQSLRDRPIPEQAPMRALREGFRKHPLAIDALSDEPLVDASAAGLAGRNFYADDRNPPHYAAVPGAVDALLARAGVVERLRSVDRRLAAAGLRLWLFDAWRPTAVQRYFHDEWMPARVRAARPDADEAAVAAEVEHYWAAPTVDPSSPAPHATGGAVDLTLCWREDHERLWLGSLFDDVTRIARLDRLERPSEDGSLSDDEARANRRLLYWVMRDAGFAANPNEWWHFSFGDQMWARLTGQPAASYGAISPSPARWPTAGDRHKFRPGASHGDS